MSRNARYPDSEPTELDKQSIAAYLLARRAATLRFCLAIVVPLAAAAIVVACVPHSATSGASVLLDVIAFGSSGIGTYLASRAGRGLFPDADQDQD